MITPEMIKDGKEFLTDQWGEDGKTVINECAKYQPLDMNCSEFLDHCTACGGNWGGMFLTGLKELRPTVWDAIPDNMGEMAFICICYVLILCGVDTSE